MGQKIVVITSDNTVEEVLNFEKRDYSLRFDEEDFLELPDEVIGKLSFYNQRSYWLAKAAWEGGKKTKERQQLFGSIRVLDPLDGRATNKISWHSKRKDVEVVWKRPDEVEGCKALGYRLLSNEDKDIVTPGATKVSSSRVIETRDGKPDLVAMVLPKKLHDQHLEAVAFKSQSRLRSATDELRAQLEQLNKGIRLVDNTTEEKETIRR